MDSVKQNCDVSLFFSYPTGNTLTYDALSFARTDMFRERNGMRPNASQIAIVITDGKYRR